jgi:mono/diheme cytochrome c family protein
MSRASLLIGILMMAAATGPMVLATPPSPPPPSDLGRQIYEQHCLDCHGARGHGDGAKAPFLSPRPGNLVSAATSAKSDKDLLKIIANGRARTAMPAWKDHLSEEEQREVLRHIRSFVHFHQSATPPPPGP